MGQLDLFGTADRVLVDDDTGRIEYFPSAIDDATAEAAFALLVANAPWKAERRMMYDREVDVPRLGCSLRPGDAAAYGLAGALHIVETLAQTRYNSIGANLYRDGNDSVAPHNDRTNDLLDERPIALLSLGSVRRMTIRGKTSPRRAFDLDLEPGSVLVMSYSSQFHYDHGIPKVPFAHPRISLAFRVRL